MAATKAELLLSALQISDPLAGFAPPLSPLDGYPKLEELQLLLQNAAAGGSLLAASAAEGAGLLSGEPGEYGGELRGGGGGVFNKTLKRFHHHQRLTEFKVFH